MTAAKPQRVTTREQRAEVARLCNLHQCGDSQCIDSEITREWIDTGDTEDSGMHLPEPLAVLEALAQRDVELKRLRQIEEAAKAWKSAHSIWTSVVTAESAGGPEVRLACEDLCKAEGVLIAALREETEERDE